jgi:beta-glucosidase
VLASTWNPEMARLHGMILGAEARFRGKDIILAPGINIIRTPLNGRNFEYMSEDPFLVSSLVVPDIQGIQSNDVSACVKHFILNNQELNRFYTDVEVSERALREIYLPGFKAAVLDGEARSLMSAYNRFRGVPCAQNQYLIKQILQGEWNSDTVVVTDWNIRGLETIPASHAGLDIEMGTTLPYDQYKMADPLLAAVRSGKVSVDEIDEKVRRILRMMDLDKMFDPASRNPGSYNTKEHQDATRKIAEEGVILLQNKDESLPLRPEKTKHIVVVGVNAEAIHHNGGGSSAIQAKYEITPLQGIKKRFTDAQIDYFPGYKLLDDKDMETIPPECIASRAADSGIPAWTINFFGNTNLSGKVIDTLYVPTIDFNWPESPTEKIPADNFSAKASATIIPDLSGTYRFFADSDDGTRLYVNGTLLVDNWKMQSYTAKYGEIHLEAGKKYQVDVEFFEGGYGAKWKVGWTTARTQLLAEENEQKMLDIAKTADAVLFIGGLNKSFDEEGQDRTDMKLPYGQDALIERLAAANPRTQVYLVAGSAVEMPWKDKVSAIVWVGYAGMETGNALAAIIAGDVSPSGHLPFSLPKKLDDIGAHALDAYQKGICEYKEGVFVGYRWLDTKEIEPLFPFGHGLSYSQFGYSNLTVAPDGSSVTFTVVNKGKYPSAAVAQLYVSDLKCSVERPLRELKGFKKVFLNPGESREVLLPLPDSAFAFFDDTRMKWRVEAGTFEIAAGNSSRDLPLKIKISRSGAIFD